MKVHNNKTDSEKNFLQLSSHATAHDESFFCAHIGPSMNPTLTAQDLLEIKPFHNEWPQVGDVILFQSPENDHYVVHRIINITAQNIQTRGDNNCNIDPDFLKQDYICGRVIAAHRGNSRRKIANDCWGRLVGKYCHLRRLALNQAVKFWGPVYRSLCTGGLLHWLIPVRLSPQVATFRSDTHGFHKLLLGNRIIGSYDDNHLQWQIKRPYRILVDESSLPKPR